MHAFDEFEEAKRRLQVATAVIIKLRKHLPTKTRKTLSKRNAI